MKIHLEYLRLSLKQIYDIILKLDVYILKQKLQTVTGPQSAADL